MGHKLFIVLNFLLSLFPIACSSDPMFSQYDAVSKHCLWKLEKNVDLAT